ncbi:MAG: hypothetical protein ACRDNY_07000 [Gaiellaceae bacterium]
MLASLAAVIAAVVASSAAAALFFLFEPGSAEPGDVVTVRLGGTPAGFTLERRERPFRRAIRVYLVPNGVAADVTSRFDPRLHFIGSLVPDAYGHGVLMFTAPPLDSGVYAVAAWCRQCATSSFGRTFFVLPVSRFTLSRFPGMLLRLRMPPATETCPVSGEGTYGNGLLSTRLPPGGVLSTRRDEDGLFQKLGWLPHRPFPDALTVRGERLDAPSPPMRVLGVFWGYASSGPAANGSWASAVKFPSAGCWRISARVQDVTLSYVVRVVAGW